MAEHHDQPERPRLEPEIIPPARSRGDNEWPPHAWPPYASAHTRQRIYVARLGPFGFALLMAIIGIVVALILLAVVGAILVWIPILALLLAAGFVYRLLRRERPLGR
ncbi:MAG: hypothetical protein KGI48_10930 [Hyphomicrobiales bacterium]|jgi:hypothetical protein|nr:hypothetical protein [Hyphomicrobiales bacterium]